jgi:AraC-like DNA-binding protein
MQTQATETFVPKVGPHRIHCQATWEKLAQQARYRPQALTELVGVSMRTLQRCFRSRYDKTVSDWLRDLRLDHALKKVKNCQSVKEVAFELGYKQPSHFTRDFKKKYGVPPRSLMSGRYSHLPAH